MTRKFIFGTAGLHRIAWRPSRQRLLQIAFEAGFRAFDTAPLYGNGLAESEIGASLSAHRSLIQLTTKFGIPVSLYGAARPWTFVAERAARMVLDRGYRSSFDNRIWSTSQMRSDLEGSLRRLRTSHVERFCLHEPLGPLPQAVWADLAGAAADLKREGKILSFGISGEHACMAELSALPGIDFVQTRSNLAAQIAANFAGTTLIYGLYGQFRASGATGGDFLSYLKGPAIFERATGLVLSSTKPQSVHSYAALFG